MDISLRLGLVTGHGPGLQFSLRLNPPSVLVASSWVPAQGCSQWWRANQGRPSVRVRVRVRAKVGARVAGGGSALELMLAEPRVRVRVRVPVRAGHEIEFSLSLNPPSVLVASSWD